MNIRSFHIQEKDARKRKPNTKTPVLSTKGYYEMLFFLERLLSSISQLYKTIIIIVIITNKCRDTTTIASQSSA